MLGVVVFIGGKFRYGSEGVGYSKSPKYSFPVTSDHTFDDVKGMIYSRIGYTEDQYGLDLQTKIDAGKGNKNFFQLLPITDQGGWEMTYQIFVAAGIPVIEIYVELVPSVTGMNLNSGHSSGFEHIPEPTPEPWSRPEPRTRPESSRVYESRPTPQPVQETGPDVPIDAIPDQYLDSGDQFGDGGEEDWEADDLSDGDGPIPPPRNLVFPITGRTSRHPVDDFNDISAFQEADVGFLGKSRVFEKNELSPGQISSQYKYKEQSHRPSLNHGCSTRLVRLTSSQYKYKEQSHHPSLVDHLSSTMSVRLTSSNHKDCQQNRHPKGVHPDFADGVRWIALAVLGYANILSTMLLLPAFGSYLAADPVLVPHD